MSTLNNTRCITCGEKITYRVFYKKRRIDMFVKDARLTFNWFVGDFITYGKTRYRVVSVNVSELRNRVHIYVTEDNPYTGE